MCNGVHQISFRRMHLPYCNRSKRKLIIFKKRIPADQVLLIHPDHTIRIRLQLPTPKRHLHTDLILIVKKAIKKCYMKFCSRKRKSCLRLPFPCFRILLPDQDFHLCLFRFILTLIGHGLSGIHRDLPQLCVQYITFRCFSLFDVIGTLRQIFCLPISFLVCPDYADCLGCPTFTDGILCPFQ